MSTTRGQLRYLRKAVAEMRRERERREDAMAVVLYGDVRAFLREVDGFWQQAMRRVLRGGR